jgi:hypothetical protein
MIFETCHITVAGDDLLGRVAALCNEIKLQRVSASCHTICSRIIRTVKSTICGTSYVVRAQCRIPCVSGVAIGCAASLMDPAPVGVDDNLSSSCGTCVFAGAGLPCHGRVCLCKLSSDLLRSGNSKKTGEDCNRLIHDES